MFQNMRQCDCSSLLQGFANSCSFQKGKIHQQCFLFSSLVSLACEIMSQPCVSFSASDNNKAFCCLQPTVNAVQKWGPGRENSGTFPVYRIWKYLLSSLLLGKSLPPGVSHTSRLAKVLKCVSAPRAQPRGRQSWAGI